jgi:hypothetical protein
MAATYRVIVRARDNGTGYTYLITCTDDPVYGEFVNPRINASARAVL